MFRPFTLLLDCVLLLTGASAMSGSGTLDGSNFGKPPGWCDFSLTGGDTYDCYLSVDLPGEYTFSQCDGLNSPYCSAMDADLTMTIVGHESDGLVDHSATCQFGGNCPKFTFGAPDVGPYTLRISCESNNGGGIGSGSCEGRVSVEFTGETPEPTVSPTNLAFDTNPGQLCDPFDLPADPMNTGTVYKSCMFNPSPGLVKFTMCQLDESAESLPAPFDQAMCHSQDAQLLVFDAADQNVYENVQISPSVCGCTDLIIDFTNNYANGPFELRQKCGSSYQGCSGTTAIFSLAATDAPTTAPTDAPAADPTFAPSTRQPTMYVPPELGNINGPGTGAVCDQFSIVNGYTGEYRSCFFSASMDTIVVSQCAADVPLDFAGATPQCSGGSQLEVYQDGNRVASNDGLACGCAKLQFDVEYTGQNIRYEVRQACGRGQGLSCSGRTGVFAIGTPSLAPTYDPSYEPTYEPSPQVVVDATDPPTDPPTEPDPDPDSTGTPTLFPTTAPLSPLNFRADTYKVKNGFAFAARASDGTVHTWGEAPYGGDSEDAAFGNVTSIVSSRFAFAAVNFDRTIVPWGARTAIVGVSAGQVTGLVANEAAFAGVLSGTSGVLALGSKHNGGDVTSDARCNGFSDELSSGVKSITAAACAFTALKTDSTVYAWGNMHCGAGVSSVSNTALVGVQKVVATREAFAALLSTGAVKVWGGSLAGGDASSAGTALDGGVVDIVAGREVFVAVKSGGKLVVWGYGPYGGDASLVQQHLDSGVTSVAHTFTAFAALKDTGAVHTWGRADSGGDSSAVSAQLHDIVSIHGAGKAFAAINSTGGVVAWGKAAYGGVIPADKRVALSSGVVSIHSTDRAFVALKADGGVVVWGQAGHGGSPGAAVEALLARRPVHTVCSNDAAFSAINTDGEVIGWGHPVSIAAPGVIFSSDSLKLAAKCD